MWNVIFAEQFFKLLLIARDFDIFYDILDCFLKLI